MPAQKHGDTNPAKRSLQRLLIVGSNASSGIVMDKLKSYTAAKGRFFRGQTSAKSLSELQARDFAPAEPTTRTGMPGNKSMRPARRFFVRHSRTHSHFQHRPISYRLPTIDLFERLPSVSGGM
jgi:hypothetical protein